MDVNPDNESIKIHEVPKDWTFKCLGDLGKIVRGGSPRPAGDPRYFNGKFIPWLTVAALTNIAEYQLEITETESSLTKEGARHSRTLPAGTVILANSGATLGVAKILSINSCANDGIAAIINQFDGDKRFVCQFINTRTKHLRDVVATGNGQPNLNTALIRDIPIPFPPLREQRVIAEALGDVDALLGALDRLIAKKRDLKQAAMQQLLTGQTRLPGFDGVWKEVELGDVVFIRNSKLLASATPRGTQSVELEFLDQGNGRLLMSADASGEVLKYSFKKGDVLFGRLRAYLRKYWHASFAGICSTEIWPLTARDNRLSNQFLYFIVQTDDFGNAAALSYGTHMPRSDWLVLKKLLIQLPSLAEQTAIATILSDMDAELEALEQRRAKTATLKQGMMQELLTGRTRLV
jgi:type I restriction enzyme S subunit